MSIEKVRLYLNEKGYAEKIQEFEVSSATVELAGLALGVEGKRIAKTLSFDVSGTPVLIVCAGDAKVNNSKFKQEFQTKAKMFDHDSVAEKIGHAVGGVCPFAVNDGVKVYLDESLKRFETVFPACGSSNSAIELSIQELEELSNYEKWIDVTKLPEEV
ncbi:MAG: YbaK/EbsC family protein [Clostridia bacterium]|nr:YbaK/EbsC family protein [Clostridia bacterium]